MADFNDIFGNLFGTLNQFDIPNSCEKLNEYWKHGDIKGYYYLLNNLKKAGYRILRNSNGIHKMEET